MSFHVLSFSLSFSLSLPFPSSLFTVSCLLPLAEPLFFSPFLCSHSRLDPEARRPVAEAVEGSSSSQGAWAAWNFPKSLGRCFWCLFFLFFFFFCCVYSRFVLLFACGLPVFVPGEDGSKSKKKRMQKREPPEMFHNLTHPAVANWSFCWWKKAGNFKITKTSIFYFDLPFSLLFLYVLSTRILSLAAFQGRFIQRGPLFSLFPSFFLHVFPAFPACFLTFACFFACFEEPQGLLFLALFGRPRPFFFTVDNGKQNRTTQEFSQLPNNFFFDIFPFSNLSLTAVKKRSQNL